MAGFAGILECELGVIARSRVITKYPETARTRRQEGHPDIPARTRRERTVFGRIVDRERPVVVLLAIYKVARERQSVCESDVKLDLFATQIRRGRQGRDLGKRPVELLHAFKKRGSRQRALSRSAPPFDSGFGHPCLREVMREQLRLALGNLRKLVFERFSNAQLQHARCTPALLKHSKTNLRRLPKASRSCSAVTSRRQREKRSRYQMVAHY